MTSAISESSSPSSPLRRLETSESTISVHIHSPPTGLSTIETIIHLHQITLAGIFWKREPLPPPPPEPAPTPSLPPRRIMSRTPEQPGLTPQFCFNQTALRGKALYIFNIIP